MGLMAGVTRCLLLGVVVLVLPLAVASQLTPLTVQRVWTQDTGGTEKTSFLPGETIQFAAELNNPYGGWLLGANGTGLSITTSFYTDTQSVDIPPGVSTWTWNATAPSTEDTYTVTVQAYDHASGTLPEGSANFTITLGQTPPPEQICHTLDAQQPVREGWGAAYDVFSAEQEVLLKASCTPDETHITVGNNDEHTYIYHLGYQRLNEQWEQIDLQCSGEKQGGAWCVGEATGVISAQSPYFTAYTCRFVDNSWKCGCRDKQCAQPFWQLQQVERGQAPAAPSNVQVEEITHEGRPSTKVSWTDNADNELGFVIVDQNRPQEFDTEPVLGIGATGSLILPFVSDFCVYAYNDYGISDSVCSGEVVAPADSFTYPVDRSKAWRNDYDGHTNLPNDWSKCYNVAYNVPWHAGQDYGFPARKAPDGTWTNDTPVNAVANGVVRYSSKDPGTTKSYPGGVVIIEHTLPDGQLIYSMYGHLDPSKILVSASTEEKVIVVTKGQQIASGLKPQVGRIDNTHLHWEMRYFYDGSEIKQAPNYTGPCATEPGPGYTYHKNDALAHPENFQGVIGKNPDGTFKYKLFHWTNPEEFVADHQ